MTQKIKKFLMKIEEQRVKKRKTPKQIRKTVKKKHSKIIILIIIFAKIIKKFKC